MTMSAIGYRPGADSLSVRMPETSKLPTIGSIARRLGVEPHRVRYVLQTRRLMPAGWAGHARVFSEEDVERIREFLVQIDAAKGGTRA